MTTGSLAVVGGVVVGSEGAVRADIVIVDGVIQHVGREAPRSDAIRVLSAVDLVIAPGFIDLQVNGAHGIDLAGEPERLGELAALLPRYGVTAFCPTIVTSPPEVVARAISTWQARRADGGVPGGAVPIGLHVEGPMLNPARKGAHNRAYLRSPSSDVIAGWSRDAGVVLVTLAPELPGALDIVAALRERGVLVAAGHTDATASEIEAALDAGVTVLTHLFNAMRPFAHREPGPIGVAFADQRLVAGLIVDGIHVHPTAVAAAWRAMGPERIALVTDAVGALGRPFGPARLGDVMTTVGPDGVRLADGRLAGSNLSMDRAVGNLMSFTGCSLGEAVTSAATTPAAVLGDSSRGVVEPGRRGDLVVLRGSSDVVATVVAGEVVWRS